jgi:hypothetical protein
MPSALPRALQRASAPGSVLTGGRDRPARRSASYWALSRAPRYALVFALPLLVLYEALAALLGDLAGLRVRNGADVWLKTPFIALFGPRGPVVFGALVVGGAAVLVWRDVRRTRDGVRAGVLLRMFAESVLLALVCAVAVGVVTAELLRVVPAALALVPHGVPHAVPRALHGLAAAGAASDTPIGRLGVPAQLMLSLGAGLYEELLFRVVLVGTLGALARRLLGFGPAAAGAVAVLGGALLFSLSHHVGAYGDPFTMQAFTFRLVAGLFFSSVYVLRGFGIAAWTHALYDVGVLVLRG